MIKTVNCHCGRDVEVYVDVSASIRGPMRDTRGYMVDARRDPELPFNCDNCLAFDGEACVKTRRALTATARYNTPGSCPILK